MGRWGGGGGIFFTKIPSLKIKKSFFWVPWWHGGGVGWGGGASVSEFFCYESKPKISDFFFLQRIQILKKKFAGWRGWGGVLLREGGG